MKPLSIKLFIIILISFPAILKAQTFIEDTIPNIISLWGCSGDWGDYDNDGDKDLLISGIDNNGYRNMKVYRNDNNSVFTDINVNPSLAGTSSGSVDWGDYDNNGLLDILITGFNGMYVITELYYQVSVGNFEQDTITLPEVTMGTAKFGDYDNDEDLDIAISGFHAPFSGDWYYLTKIYRNDGNGVFTDINAPMIPLQMSSVDWGDMDNDGDLDLLVIGQDTNDVDHSIIYRNEGSNVFTDISAGLTGVHGGVCKWGDYNNDGDLDFFIAGYDGSTSKFIIYKNTDSSFTPLTTNIEGGTSGDADWGDYDNDGLPDIITSGNNQTMKITKVYHNDGNDIFSLLPETFPGLNTSIALWEDYTGDGKLDFVIAGETNTSGQILTKMYKQQYTTGFTDKLLLNNVAIYPNPTRGKFIVEVENYSQNITLEIYNWLGESVLINNVFSERKEIDLSNFHKGIYLVKISDGNILYSEKIIVQ
jgi:hypothetical protein